MSKDNANPVIHSIVNSRRKEHKPLGAFQRWQEGGLVLVALSLPPESSSGTASPSARTDCSANTSASTSRKLLENGGLQITPTLASQRGPSYTLSAKQTQLKSAHLECKPIERELMDADEVFDMIRNIQDPEHPLTLEQLNVVNRDHVSVHDCGDNNHKSTVLVRFTWVPKQCNAQFVLIVLSFDLFWMRHNYSSITHSLALSFHLTIAHSTRLPTYKS